MFGYLNQAISFFGFAVCHQLPEKTFIVAGFRLSFCARCLGIYLAIFLILFYFFFYKILIKKQRPALMLPLGYYFFSLALITLMGLDVFAQLFGLYFSNVTRFFSGIGFGFALMVFVLTLLAPKFLGKSTKMIFGKKEFFFLYFLLGIFCFLSLKFSFLLKVENLLAVIGLLGGGWLLNFLFLENLLAWFGKKDLPSKLKYSSCLLLLLVEICVLSWFHAIFPGLVN